MAYFRQEVYTEAEIDISVDEFVDECSERELKELAKLVNKHFGYDDSMQLFEELCKEYKIPFDIPTIDKIKDFLITLR